MIKIYFMIMRILSWCFYRCKVEKSAKIRTGRMRNGSRIEIGKNVFIGKNYKLYVIKKGENIGKIKLEDGVVMQENIHMSSVFGITIGKNTLLGSDILIIDNNHGMNPELGEGYHKQPVTGDEIVIGNECWIGDKVAILAGVKIGDKCIIGANSTVTHNIPAYSIAVGSPARVVKKYNFELHKWENVS